ncbi:MAG: oxidoreductase [Rhodospirillales bacterium]|nr:MAG: oxidoreductase [Rhodospirillales bacterium]
MAEDRFSALVLTEADGTVAGEIKELSEADLPEGDVTVRVEYSGVNYKDGLILNGLGRLVRDYPHVPGIDFAGTVAQSHHARYAPGDKVVLTGWRVGEIHWGGLAGKARVRGDWLVPLPKRLDARQAMAVGTAGFTAMLCVLALEDHGVAPGSGKIVVTGAAGGVGSVAIAILGKLGYEVAAVTGRAETHDYLRSLGATEIVAREALSEPSGKPMESAVWGGAIDTVGGATLSRLIGQMAYGAPIAACGNAGGIKIETNVLPFILRGVKLLGIDSVMQPYEERLRAWERIGHDLPMDRLESMIEEIGLEEAMAAGAKVLKGQVRGRTVVKLS